MDPLGTDHQSAAPRPNAPTSVWERLAEILFVLLLAAGIAALLIEGLVNVWTPYELEFGEGNVLASAMRVAQGQSAYAPLTQQPPYVFSQYGPLFYWVEGLLVHWFGVGFAAGRLLSLLATFVSTALLVLLLRRWTSSWRTGLLFGCLYLSLPQVGFWATTMRADPLAVALSLAGLYVVSCSIRRWPLAAWLFVAAILVKPTLVAAPAAVFLYLLAVHQDGRHRDGRREYKTALGFGALTGGLILATFAMMQRATGGAFASQLFGSHPEPYLVRHYLDLAMLVGTQQLIPTLMLAAFVALALRRGDTSRTPTLPLLYVAMALLATLSAGMAGAASNHFLDWSAAVCVGAGMAYHLAGESAAPLARPLRSAALLAMVVCALLFSSLLWLAWNSAEDSAPGPVKRAAGLLPYQQRVFPLDTDVPQGCVELQRYVAARPGDRVISENTGAVLLAGKTLLITDPYTYAQLVMAGKLPGEPVETMLRQRSISTVILAHDASRARADEAERWPPAFLDALEQNYQLERMFDCSSGAAAHVPRSAP